MARITPLLLCLLLAGCLTTPRPVFDATNSVPARESAAFMAFVESWEARLGTGDTPRALIGEGGRVVEVAGQALMQEPHDDGGAEYYLLGVMGGRPVSCMLHDRGLEAVAARHGVRLAIERGPDTDPAVPAPVEADGTDAALRAFIRDAFETAPLSCSVLGAGD